MLSYIYLLVQPTWYIIEIKQVSFFLFVSFVFSNGHASLVLTERHRLCRLCSTSKLIHARYIIIQIYYFYSPYDVFIQTFLYIFFFVFEKLFFLHLRKCLSFYSTTIRLVRKSWKPMRSLTIIMTIIYRYIRKRRRIEHNISTTF